MSSEIAVVYLARYAEGPGPVRSFIKTYREHPGGVDHDLVVVRKGFPSDDGHEQDRILRGFEAIIIDDSGVDITAYAKAAKQLPHRYVVLFNTFTEIAADDWLAKLHRAIQIPGVGIAAAMGSHESLLSSWTEASRIVWQCNRGRPYDPALEELWGHEIKVHAPIWIKKTPKDFLKLCARKMRNRMLVYDQDTADRKFYEFWNAQTGGDYDILRGIPAFPNPHIRTNGFMMARETFLATRPDMVNEKHSSFLYESGPEGLTATIQKMGLQPIVVGANGDNYELDDMLHSRTFRLDDQGNLLITDNQVRGWANMPSKRRQMYTRMSWSGMDSIKSSDWRSGSPSHHGRPKRAPNPYGPLPFSPDWFI
jgi:hypothetical protein